MVNMHGLFLFRASVAAAEQAAVPEERYPLAAVAVVVVMVAEFMPIMMELSFLQVSTRMDCSFRASAEAVVPAVDQVVLCPSAAAAMAAAEVAILI